jgi:UDP-N-acetylmuramate--alanine ligase
MQFAPDARVHIIGIGGFGMSAIARILLERGHVVSGSDRRPNALTDALAADGATIGIGHAAAHVNGADAVIATSAAPDDHIEIVAAHDADIAVYRRRDVLAELMADQKVIAVAGTHGKTTTTSMIVQVLQACGRDPSYIVGGVMANTGTNAGVGQQSLFVVEADEYGDMFLGLRPDTIVLTSLEYDHPDFFDTEAAMLEKFKAFLALLKPGGTLIACVDYPLIRDILPERGYNVITYGLGDTHAASMQGHRIRTEGSQTVFDLLVVTGGQISINAGTVHLSVPGEHNVLNAIAALTAADVHQAMMPDAIEAITAFKSTGRRFELRGEARDVLVIDDYAHHPTAIKATLEATRQCYPDRQVWAVWQPHMYSRTQQLIDAYVTAFGAADAVLVTDIYAAREEPIPGVDGAHTADRIPNAQYSGDLTTTAAYLLANVQPGSVIVIMSAGDAPQIGEQFLADYT